VLPRCYAQEARSVVTNANNRLVLTTRRNGPVRQYRLPVLSQDIASRRVMRAATTTITIRGVCDIRYDEEKEYMRAMILRGAKGVLLARQGEETRRRAREERAACYARRTARWHAAIKKKEGEALYGESARH